MNSREVGRPCGQWWAKVELSSDAPGDYMDEAEYKKAAEASSH